MSACVGKIRLQSLVEMDDKGGWANDPKNPVYFLVRERQIALPLYPQFGTEPSVPRLAVMICGGAVFVWASSGNIAKVCFNWFTRDARLTSEGFENQAGTPQPSDCADGLAA